MKQKLNTEISKKVAKETNVKEEKGNSDSDFDSEDSDDGVKIDLDPSISYSLDYDGPVSRRRFYQSIRDFAFYDVYTPELDNYMELVTQYGYLVLFGQLFPLAAIFSILSNRIQINI